MIQHNSTASRAPASTSFVGATGRSPLLPMGQPAGWRGRERLLRFVCDRRAAATALTAALLTVMSLAGIAFAGDHMWLVYQRDLLKTATDAAGIAAARVLPTLSSSLTDEQVEASLKPIAERYILANIPAGYHDQVKNSLTVTFAEINRAAGTVNVSATADLGGAIFGAWLWGSVVSKTAVGSKTERVESITEVVLAIDVTSSMRRKVNGTKNALEAVSEAALTLLDVLAKDAGNSVAVGLVPWHYNVTLNSATRTRWEDLGWATYPAKRYYSRQSEWKDPLPPKPETWKGCVDQRETSGTNPPGLSIVPPTSTPFTMEFYPARFATENSPSVAFDCDPSQSPPWTPCYAGCIQDPDKCGTIEQVSYSFCIQGGQCYSSLGNVEHFRSQPTCEPLANTTWSEFAPIEPLTTDINAIKSKINALTPDGESTYSALGVLWGHRLLAPTWRNMWNGPVHPVDPKQHKGAQKALVLLTDGHDAHPVYAADTLEQHRQTTCKAARDAGIKVFVIGVGNLPRQALTKCSSQADDPSGDYFFLYQTATSENLRAAFQSIGRQLIRFRRVS